MYFGHYISQRAARWLGGGEVLVAEYEGEWLTQACHLW